MENKFLKAAVFAMMLGVAGSAAANYVAPSSGGKNSYDDTKSNQTVVGFENVVSGTSASAYGNLNYAIGDYSTAIGFRARTDTNTGTEKGTGATGATAVGNYVTASGNHSVALGSGSTATSITKASGAQSIAIGYLTSATSDNATAFGNAASAAATDSIAIGTKAATVSGADGGIALGSSSKVSAKSALAFGTSSNAAAANALAFGTNSRVTAEAADEDNKQYAIAIGTGSYVKVANAVAIGSNSAVSAYENNPTDRVVSFGHTADDTYYDGKEEIAYGDSLTSRLINVTAGYQDTDAVNFSQIKTTKPTYTTGSTSYIQSSLNADGKTLNTNGTVGANLAALDAKMVATKTDSINTVDLGDSNKIVSNDGTVLATFKKGTLEEGTSLTATDFVTNGDVYAAIAARAQKVSLDDAVAKTITNAAGESVSLKKNTIYNNNGEALVEFETETPDSVTGKKFVTSGDVFAADVKTGQTVSLDSAVGTSTTTNKAGETVSLKQNTIYSNNGDELVTFDVEEGNVPVVDSKKFISSGQAYAGDVAEQTITLETNKNIIKNNNNDGLVTLQTATYVKDDKGFVSGGQLWSESIKAGQKPTFATDNNVIKNNDDDVLVTFEEGTVAVDGGASGATNEGTKFVSERRAYANDVAYQQTVTLDTTNVDGKTVQKNQIATNDGAVVATFEVEEGNLPAEGSKKFVNSGQAYAGDVAEQTITLETNKNIIKNNNDDGLVTLQTATYAPNDKGFVSGGLLWSHSIASGQTPSFATTSTGKEAAKGDTNVIRDNDGNVLVRFTEGVVAVSKGTTAKSTIDDPNFVSARNAYANDVAYAQDLTLNIANKYTADIYTNAGAKVGTLKIEGGEIASGNTGFVTGDQVWKAIAKYNQVIDFSKKDTTTTDTDSTTPDTDTTDTDADSGKTDTDQDSTKTDSKTDSPTTNGNIVTNDETGSETGSETEGGDTTGGDQPDQPGGDQDGDQGGDQGGDIPGDGTAGSETAGGDTTGGDSGDAGNPDSGDSGDHGTGDADKPTTQVLNNKIYANDGTVIAELRQGEVANEDTGFVSGGQVYAEDVKNGQKIDATNLVIKNNAEDKDLVTFTEGKVEANNQGFVSGDQVNTVKSDLNDADVKPGQKVDAENLAITNNKGDKLVTFTKGEVTAGNQGFVSGDQVNTVKTDLSNADVKSGQKIDAENLAITNNKGDKLVTFTKGEVTAGNQGFVSGGDVYTVKTEISKDIETVKTDLNNQITQTNQNLTNLGGQVNEVEERVNKVGAGAAALAALHPMDYDPNAKLTFAVGYGNYRSKSAGAIGAFIRPNDRFMWSLGATMGNGENMYNTGLSFAIGSGKGHRMSRAELDYKVGNLSDQLTQMQAEHQTFARDNAQQDAAILDLHARLKRVEEILAQLTAK